MSSKKLAVLGMIAALMVGWAILQNRIGQTVNTADFSSSALIEGLQIEVVAGITMTSEKGEKTTTLNRKDGVFVVADKDDYPADVAAVNALFNGCLDIRTREKTTDNPNNHADLKVTPETARSVVSFTDADGGQIVALVLSPSNEKGEAFARRLSETAVYSIQHSPQINTDPMDFVDTQLFQVPQDQLSSVAVRTPEGSYILTVSDDGAEIELKDMPAGKQYKETVYKSVFGALNSLRFDDVIHAGNVSQEFQFNFLYTCKLKDKTVYKLMLTKKDGEIYAKVLADYLDKTPVEKTVGQVESEEELKAKEAKLLAIDAVKAFNKKHGGWVYQIPVPNAGNLMMPLSELLEEAPEPVSEMDPNAVQ
ncbi:MAG: hypothetical protein B6I25_03595 [Planctomycetales bacterium 4572_13]|nr:MAG: hypothetical protein B6I25_03595 [Planctomycetales bacterium 4572_13]